GHWERQPGQFQRVASGDPVHGSWLLQGVEACRAWPGPDIYIGVAGECKVIRRAACGSQSRNGRCRFTARTPVGARNQCFGRTGLGSPPAREALAASTLPGSGGGGGVARGRDGSGDAILIRRWFETPFGVATVISSTGRPPAPGVGAASAATVTLSR